MLMRIPFVRLVSLALAVISISPSQASEADSLRHPLEKHLANIRQLTFGGTNAEAYFSFADDRLVFQSTRPPYLCDQIFTMALDGSEQRLASTGTGVTTCAYFFPDGDHILYASTHAAGPNCFPRPDKSKGYVWGVYHAYDIYRAGLDGSTPELLFASQGYDAEATVSPAGNRIVFTSSRDGDLDLYTMAIDGSDVRRITNQLGYDGGAFFSWDGSKIVYRAHHPKEDTAIAEYRQLLAEQLVKPTRMELFVCNADGTNRQQLTNNGAANFAPFFFPDNRRIIFATNVKDSAGRVFNLHIIDSETKSQEQITYGGLFNAFPMFTRDGKNIVFISDRNAATRYEFNIFIADWIE